MCERFASEGDAEDSGEDSLKDHHVFSGDGRKRFFVNFAIDGFWHREWALKNCRWNLQARDLHRIQNLVMEFQSPVSGPKCGSKNSQKEECCTERASSE